MFGREAEGARADPLVILDSSPTDATVCMSLSSSAFIVRWMSLSFEVGLFDDLRFFT